MSCLDCNDCNQSPIYPVNTALPGPPGASAFVYVAFATTVNNIGTPISSSASGFVNNQPNANSAFIAIITTNTPFPGNPPASAFNGYWVPLQGVTVSGINLQDDNVAVGGGPFTTLDFRGAGLTGVTVTNAGAGEAEIQITTAGFIKTSYADLAAIVAGSTLNPGAYYWIVDAGDAEGDYTGLYKPECSLAYYTGMLPANIATYPHNAGIIVRASSTNQFEASAIYLARVPSAIAPSSVFSLGKNYSPGNKVVSYGQVFEANSLGAFNADIEPADDPTRWDYVVKDHPTDYVTEAQSCLFEFTPQATAPFGRVRARWDNKGNYLKNTNSTGTFNEGLKKIFRWGLSSVHSNQINFYDDSIRRGAADPKRSPNFTNSNTNYCNIFNFSRNTVDTKLNPGPVVTGSTYYGTRFINVSIDSNGEITNNSFNNAVLGKILTNNIGSGAVGSQVRILNNTIENSVLYNINIRTFENNTITDNTVIGDVYYRGYDGYSQPSKFSFLGEMNFDTVPTNIMQYGGGSKSWIISTAVGSVTSAAPNTIINLAQTTFAQIAPTADIVLFGSNIVPSISLNSTIHTVIGVPTPQQFEIAGVYATGGPGNITVTFFGASIPTSFTVFNNNIIKNSVIRGLNKNTHSNQCFFTGNTITYSYIENYEFRTSPAGNTFDNGNAYSNPGNEFGSITNPPSSVGTSENYTFARNIITNSNFVGNRIANIFSENIISGGLFYSNAPTVNGGTAVGFIGNFRTNTIDSEKGSIGISPIQLYSQSTGIRFTNNSFKINSIFSDNSLRRDVFLNVVTLEDNSGSDNAAQFSGNKFEGATYNSSTVGGALGNACGLNTVTFARNTVCVQNTFEGRQASWENLTIIARDRVNIKQNMFTPNIINLTTKDFVLTGAGKASPYNQLGPQFFGSSSNPIVNITNVTQGVPVPQTFGSITYQVAPYTFELVTQFPHMMNADWVGKSVSLLITGFGSNALTFIGDNIGSPSSPNGQYIQVGTASIAGSIATIVDDYTFTCTTVQNNGYYWVSTTNTVADGNGTILPALTPGCPPAGSYNPLNDTQSTVTPNYWFTQYQPKPFSYYNSASSSIISHSGFEPQVRIALKSSTIPTPTTPIDISMAALSSRRMYVYRDWNTSTTPLYVSGTKTLTLPHFFDVMSNTVVFGSSVVGTYEIDVINNMPENVLVRFVALPGCTVQFNLQPVTPTLTSNRIIEVNNQTTLTIKSYFPTTGTASSFAVFDEIVLIRRGNFIKVDDRVIHTF